MAFARAGWNPIGGQSKSGSAPSIYAYTTADTVAVCNTAAYFNTMSDILNVGDLIFINSSTGGTLVATLNYVLTNASGVVDVTDGTVLASTDSD
tara:strand:+ start:1253 stop:1534 length:282 start_codon:yes stop_codon:yes gene_type:complete